MFVLSAGKQWCGGATESPESNCRCSDSKVKHKTWFNVDVGVPFCFALCRPPFTLIFWFLDFTGLCCYVCSLKKIVSKGQQSEPEQEPSKLVLADELDLLRSSQRRIESLVGFEDCFFFVCLFYIYSAYMCTWLWSRSLIYNTFQCTWSYFSMQEEESSLMLEHVVKLSKEVCYYWPFLI